MGIKYNYIDQGEDFKANTAILFCETTGKPLIEIIIKDPQVDIMNYVSVNSPYDKNGGSGECKIVGLLSCGPIDKETVILDIDTEECKDGLITKVKVKRDDKSK